MTCNRSADVYSIAGEIRRVSLVFLFLAWACPLSAEAQSVRIPARAKPRKPDSVIRQTIVIDGRTMKQDTFYVKDLPRYTSENSLYAPVDTERIVILRSDQKSAAQGLVQMNELSQRGSDSDKQGSIKYHNLPYTNPRLNLQIKLAKASIRHIDDLKFYLTVTNSTPYPQQFLFDRPRQPGFVLWGASCRISSPANRILLHETRQRYSVKAADKDARAHMLRLKPYEWMMKQFSVGDIAVLNETVCKNGKIPPGTYTLQFILQENYSNVVTFTVTK